MVKLKKLTNKQKEFLEVCYGLDITSAIKLTLHERSVLNSVLSSGIYSPSGYTRNTLLLIRTKYLAYMTRIK